MPKRNTAEAPCRAASTKRVDTSRTVLVASRFFGGTSRFFETRAPTKGSLPPILAPPAAAEAAGSASPAPPPPHTLLLGTQASDNALDAARAFATNASAFWHILGDALGFRRGFHHGAERVEPIPSIAPSLLHGEERSVDYEEAAARLVAASS